MPKLTFRDLMNRSHLDSLEEQILVLSQELGEAHKCSEMDIAHAMVCAAGELAKRGEVRRSMNESFDYHVIQQCAKSIARIRAKYC